MTAHFRPDAAFESIAAVYSRNIQALRVFAHTIALYADEHDVKTVEAFNSATAILYEPVLAGLPVVGRSETTVDRAESSSGPNEQKIDRLVEQRVTEAFKDPAFRRKFIAASRAMEKAAPIQGAILRASTLISLLSHFEGLVADLVHAYYTRYPASLSGEERTITLADLRSLGSVTEAEKMLVSKEVDGLLRETLANQLAYFSKKLKVDLKPIRKFEPRVVEADQRRNLLVHNRGIVNRVYLEKVDQSVAGEFHLSEGDDARVSAEYLSAALDLFEVCGTILLQVCWRKWAKDQLQSADRSLSHNLIFEALSDGRNSVVVDLSEFALGANLSEDAVTKAVCINKAAAHRNLNQEDLATATLASLDWSASSLRYQVALHAVRGEYDKCIDAIPKAIAAEDMSGDDLEAWPILAPLRETEG